MSHDLYNTQFANIFHQRRGNPVPALDCQLFLKTIPAYDAARSPRATAVWDIGPVYPTTTGLLIPVVTGPKEQHVFVLKLIELEQDAVFSVAYTSPEGIQHALQEALQFGLAINADNTEMATDPIYKGLVQVLGYEIHEVEKGWRQVRLMIGPEVKTLPADHRFPLALVMSDLVLHQPSVESLLRSGETRYLSHTLPHALAELHKERTYPVPFEVAVQYAGIEATEEKLVKNTTVFLRGLERIRQEPVLATELDKIWQEEAAQALSELLVRLFIKKRQQLKKVLLQRIQQGFVKHIHGDLKPEHIYKRSTGIPPHSPQASYFGYIDPIDFNKALMIGDIQIDTYHLVNAIRAQYPAGSYLTLAKNLKLKHKALTGQPDDFAGYFANSFYDFQNVIIRIGTKTYFKTEYDDAMLYVRLLPSRLRHLTQAAADL